MSDKILRDPPWITARVLVIAVIEEGHNTYVQTFFPGDVDGIESGEYYTVKVEKHKLDLQVTLDNLRVAEVAA